jgi:hypothetical protein
MTNLIGMRAELSLSAEWWLELIILRQTFPMHVYFVVTILFAGLREFQLL